MTMTETAAAIERDIQIDAPLTDVWAALTEPELLSQWFAKQVEWELRPGGEGTITFDYNGGLHVVPLRVAAVEPPRRLAYRWNFPEGDEPTESNSLVVEFTLSEQAGRTTVRLTESGYDRLDKPAADVQALYDDHVQGWQQLTGQLAAHFEGTTADR